MRYLTAAVWVLAAAVPAFAQAPPGRFQRLTTDGVSVFSPTEILWTLHLKENEPLPEPVDELSARLQRRYRREGYAKATVAATWDDTTGRLTVEADEGRIDAVAFEGIEPQLAEDMRDAFSVRPGDLYNTRAISRALETLLEPTRGAIRLRDTARAEPGTVFTDSEQLRRTTSGSPFDLVDEDGRKTLVVRLRRVAADIDPSIGSEGREDWYSPVDGMNVAFGVGGAIFDQRRFDHTYIQAYVSYKFARERFGYAFGFERPLFGGAGAPRLLLHADVHDITASDDSWRLSQTEQSLVSLSFKNSFRDYYNERGFLIGAAFQPNRVNEIRASWNMDRQEGLSNEADYSFFRDAETFRPNALAADGSLRAIRLGYTLDTRGLDAESGRSSLQRHVGPSLFGTFGGRDPGLRLEWTSELARPAFGGDFDFSRHIANVRGYLPLSPLQRLNGRLIVGTSSGALPPQRTFALGGIGTVHGYSFKQFAGERMVLANVEYYLGSYRHVAFVAFFDAGRVYRPVGSSAAPDDPEQWMRGLGVGGAIGDLRVDFGFRADDVPKSLQVLVRFGPTF
jgi:hypothetical protein